MSSLNKSLDQANLDRSNLDRASQQLRLQAELLLFHLRNLQPSNKIGDVWIDVVEVLNIQTKVEKLDLACKEYDDIKANIT